VQSLKDAMAERFDGFYEAQIRVQWEYCHNGYVPEAEGPMFVDESAVFSDMWPDWV
jgi:hypothetical protein